MPPYQDQNGGTGELMPFAGYDDFDDCVRSNSDKRDPAGYCAEIQRRSESKGDTRGREDIQQTMHRLFRPVTVSKKYHRGMKRR